MQTLILYAALAIVLILNLATFFLWSWLNSLVHRADPLLGTKTAAVYTRYLFMQLMRGPFTFQGSMETLGRPGNDKVVKAVTSSNSYALIASITSVIKYVPLNFIPMFV